MLGAKQLVLSASVRRALGHLRPELRAVAFYNTSSAMQRFRSWAATDTSISTLFLPIV